MIGRMADRLVSNVSLKDRATATTMAQEAVAQVVVVVAVEVAFNAITTSNQAAVEVAAHQSNRSRLASTLLSHDARGVFAVVSWFGLDYFISHLFFFFLLHVLLFNIEDRMDYLGFFYHHSAALQCSYSRRFSTLEDHFPYYSRRKHSTTFFFSMDGNYVY